MVIFRFKQMYLLTDLHETFGIYVKSYYETKSFMIFVLFRQKENSYIIVFRFLIQVVILQYKRLFNYAINRLMQISMVVDDGKDTSGYQTSME